VRAPRIAQVARGTEAVRGYHCAADCRAASGSNAALSVAVRTVSVMGLSISVGLLCDLARSGDSEGFEYHSSAFGQLTRALAKEDIDWREPEVHPETDGDHHSAGFPYSYLTHLRRIYTLARLGNPITPASTRSDEEYELDLEDVSDETLMFDSHLLCHSDADGYYIPVDFDDPLYLPEAAAPDGAGMVGSSQRLRAELAGIASAIGFQLEEDGTLSAAQVEAAMRGAGQHPFDAERYTWVGLYLACQASIEGGHAIVFC
jgi:hypothetical protein